MVEIEVFYEGDLHCRAVHGPSGQQIATDAPVDNQGRGECFSPTDLFVTSLGTCMSTIMAIAGRNHGLDLTGLRVKLRKSMSTDAPRRIARLEIDYHVPLPADHPKRALLEAAALGCPVERGLHPDIEQKVEFFWQP